MCEGGLRQAGVRGAIHAVEGGGRREGLGGVPRRHEEVPVYRCRSLGRGSQRVFKGELTGGGRDCGGRSDLCRAWEGGREPVNPAGASQVTQLVTYDWRRRREQRCGRTTAMVGATGERGHSDGEGSASGSLGRMHWIRSAQRWCSGDETVGRPGSTLGTRQPPSPSPPPLCNAIPVAKCLQLALTRRGSLVRTRHSQLARCQRIAAVLSNRCNARQVQTYIHRLAACFQVASPAGRRVCAAQSAHWPCSPSYLSLRRRAMLKP